MEYAGLYITYMPDDGPNTGGYYCQVYEDDTMEDFVDDFCVFAFELDAEHDIEMCIQEVIDGYYPLESDDPDGDYLHEYAYLYDHDNYDETEEEPYW